ncbi:hypothetical protein CRUP_022238 [Coryphaenoides rupestris]|nr:hypothetical protein CRUP_022238 [Coryphaenoides rupestris]
MEERVSLSPDDEHSDSLEDGETDVFGDLAALPVEVCERRPTCLRCRRPQKVCLCPFLPVHPLEVSTCLYIVQHPAEESRVLRTVPLLAACLPPGKCNVIIGRRFSPGSQNLEELLPPSQSDQPDPEARTAGYNVQLSSTLSSQYVIRTQPTNICLSTLECAALTLTTLERKESIREVLLRPLTALCSFQLQHGAQVHHSKEHLLRNGLYDKPMPKNKRKIKRMEKLVTEQNL